MSQPHGTGLEIVFDTESTGLDPEAGHRLVEIGCIEVENLIPTGRRYHIYLNPDREIPDEASRIHGITNEHVKDSPRFADCAEEFLAFVGAEARLVAHNASFDFKFINHELRRHGYQPLCHTRMVDTLPIARRKFPGAGASLDALCRRYEIDNSAREFHGALLDAQLLAEVYLELCGGRQPDLAMGLGTGAGAGTSLVAGERLSRVARALPGCSVSAEEQAAHTAFIGKLKGALWLTLVDAAQQLPESNAA